MKKKCAREECEEITSNAKYCSLGCFGKVNVLYLHKNGLSGRKKATHSKVCKNCKKEIARQRTYCSLKCQTSLQRQKNLIEWLMGNQTTIPSFVKEIILKEQNNKCAICDNLNEWCNKEIIFILDHIDGNSENNRRENLRLVCPNCDSQLPTFKSRNRGKGRHYRRQRYLNGESF